MITATGVEFVRSLAPGSVVEVHKRTTTDAQNTHDPQVYTHKCARSIRYFDYQNRNTIIVTALASSIREHYTLLLYCFTKLGRGSGPSRRSLNLELEEIDLGMMLECFALEARHDAEGNPEHQIISKNATNTLTSPSPNLY